MSETVQIITGIGLMLIVIILTRRYHTWKIKKAYLSIIEDLKSKRAFDPISAVDLPYGRRNILRVGLKDHRPTALKSLILDQIVGMSDDGRYYIIDKRLL